MSENVRKILHIIVAILVSIAAWTFVVYNNDPMIEVRYKDIPISFQGEDDLTNRGLGVSQISTESVDVTLRQKRVDTKDITADSITVTADVSDAAEGQNGISLQISGPEGTQVSDAEFHSISVEVEESDTVEKKIYVKYKDNAAGLEPVTSNLTSTTATVIGAKSEIERVDSVAAFITYDDTSDITKNFTTGLTAVDSDGDEIRHVVIYPGEINFRAYTGVTREVSLKVATKSTDSKNTDETSDDEGDGYIRSYTAPRTVVIKGPKVIVDSISEVYTEEIDLSSMYEDQEIEISLDLPDGIYPAYESQNLTMTVKVTKQTDTEKSE